MIVRLTKPRTNHEKKCIKTWGTKKHDFEQQKEKDHEQITQKKHQTSCKKKNDNEQQKKMPMVRTPIHGYITWCFNNLSRKIDELPQKILKMLLNSSNWWGKIYGIGWGFFFL